MTETPELTTRDVLHQVDRRLSLIEEDLRALHVKVDDNYQRLDAKFDTKIDSAYNRLDAKIDRTRVELEARIGANFHWTVGLLLASWVTLMGAVLLK
ncbi:MAG: hypothetical protein HYW07_21160 [Candidatus Latescibacteria bacterium]|nr:hypothetical protein [Candidatus Latescibacterota bacterium]